MHRKSPYYSHHAPPLPGAIWHCLEKFLVFTLECTAGIWWVKCKKVIFKSPLLYRTSPPKSAKVEKAWPFQLLFYLLSCCPSSLRTLLDSLFTLFWSQWFLCPILFVPRSAPTSMRTGIPNKPHLHQLVRPENAPSESKSHVKTPWLHPPINLLQRNPHGLWPTSWKLAASLL